MAEETTDPATALADAIEAALPGWVERSVARRAAGAGRAVDPDVARAASAAGVRARVEVGARVRRLLALDIDEQRTNPLSLLRDAVRYPTEVLRGAGVPVVERRDDFAIRAFPDDEYDLTPATWADVDPSLQDPGITWGAWKAYTHLSRRREPHPDR
jgi:hypothetical protein